MTGSPSYQTADAILGELGADRVLSQLHDGEAQDWDTPAPLSSRRALPAFPDRKSVV